jgi:hypothetical protein
LPNGYAIASARANATGKVHGGLPPFGYDYAGGELRVVEEEAEIVRFIFTEFLRTCRYVAVITPVREAGLSSSIKHTKLGVPRGVKPIGAGMIYGILRNPVLRAKSTGTIARTQAVTLRSYRPRIGKPRRP